MKCAICGSKKVNFYNHEGLYEAYYYNNFVKHLKDIFLPTLRYKNIYCRKCIILKLSIAKLKHQEVILMKKSPDNGLYTSYSGNLEDWLDRKI